MIYEWKMDGEVRNFGHAIYEVLYDKEMLWHWGQEIDKMFFIGSTYIHDDFILDALNSGYDPVFIDCAWRGERLSEELIEQASYRSVYGINTSSMLDSRNILTDFDHHPIYDLPRFNAPARSNAMALAIRNIKDPGEYNNDSKFKLGSDAVLSPVVEDADDILETIDLITGARFVLSGSLKAAMVADAYGIPFAPLSSDGFIECPDKWDDWLTAIGIDEVVFCNNVREGREWYQDVVKGRV